MPFAQPICRLGATQSAAFTNAGSTAITNAFAGQTNIVRVVALTADAFVKLDNNPSAATTDVLLQIDKPEYFTCAPGQKIAGRGVSGSGTLNVTEVSEMNDMKPLRLGANQSVAYTGTAGTVANA